MIESELFQLLCKKDRSAFDYLYSNYSKTLFGVIYHIVHDHHAAEDLLQNTFVKIWEKIDTYDHTKGKLYTWMINIARNGSIDYLRVKKNSQPITSSMDDFYTTTTYSASDTVAIGRNINRLAGKYRDVIQMIYFYGFSIKETADHFSLPEGTVKTRLRKSLLLLRSDFDVPVTQLVKD